MGDPNLSTSIAVPAGPDGGTPPAPAPAQGGEQYMQVPSGAFAGTGGDYHETVRRAKAYDELGDDANLAQKLRAAGFTSEDIDAAINNAQQGQQGSSPAPQPQGVTVEQMQQMMADQAAKFEASTAASLQAHTTQQQQMAAHQQMLEAGRQLTTTSTDAFLTTVGLKMFDEGDDGAKTPNQMGHALGLRFQDFIREATAARIPEGATDEQRAQMLFSPSAEDVAFATEKMAWAKEAKYEAAAAVATEQETIPSATLGEGPSGSEPTTDVEHMTYDQKKDFVMSKVEVSEDE